MRYVRLLGLLGASAFAFALYACGGSDTNGGAPPPPAGDDAGNPVQQGGDDAGNTGKDSGNTGNDAGADTGPNTTYPAFKPEMGQLVMNGGPVLSAPVIVSVTWPSNPDVATIEAFDDAIGATAYWKTLNSEYGVGPATSGATNHVHIPTASPATLADTDLDTLVSQSAGSPATSGWPAPTKNTVYILWMNAGTSLTLGGNDACSSGVGGYHQDTKTPGGTDVAYAIIPRCGSINEATAAASHELNEAATDPYPNTSPALVGFDANHLAFEYFQEFQSENGDACEFFKDSFYKESAPFAYEVQRQWSNKSGAAGHAPCVPVPSDPYFNVTPLNVEGITVDLSAFGGSAQTATKGFHILTGQTKTFEIGYYSDGPTSGPWSIALQEGNPIIGTVPTPRLTKAVDVSSGQNGDTAKVTVTVNTTGRTKGDLLTIVSTLNGVTHYMPILIGAQ